MPVWPAVYSKSHQVESTWLKCHQVPLLVFSYPWEAVWSHLGFAKNKLLNFVSVPFLRKLSRDTGQAVCGYSTESVRTSPGGPNASGRHRLICPWSSLYLEWGLKSTWRKVSLWNEIHHGVLVDGDQACEDLLTFLLHCISAMAAMWNRINTEQSGGPLFSV